MVVFSGFLQVPFCKPVGIHAIVYQFVEFIRALQLRQFVPVLLLIVFQPAFPKPGRFKQDLCTILGEELVVLGGQEYVGRRLQGPRLLGY